MKRRVVDIAVSDHAVLRWLEREHGLDVLAVKRHMAGLVQAGAELSAVAVCVGHVRLVLQDGPAGHASTRVAVLTSLPRDAVFVPHDKIGREDG